MSNIYYESSDGAYTTEVNRQQKTVIASERGGWSRDYTLTFDELMEYAKQWDVALDLNSDDKLVAEIATNIIRANNAAEHGGQPYRYVARTNKITEPKEVEVMKRLEHMFNKYTTEQILELMSEHTKNKLKTALKY